MTIRFTWWNGSTLVDEEISEEDFYMTDTIKWGPEIKVDGKRPAWLKDTPYEYQTDGCVDCWHNTFPGFTGIVAIRLPETHFAYTAIEQGFEPWGGGDEAPADWERFAEILYRNGRKAKGGTDFRWNHKNAAYDIIGYRKTVQTPYAEAAKPLDAITEQAFALVRKLATRKGYLSNAVDEAEKIAALLPPEPVDPDLVEARQLAADGMPHHKQPILDGSRDGSPIVSTALAAIKRGRELARQPLTEDELAAARAAYFAPRQREENAALFYARYWGLTERNDK